MDAVHQTGPESQSFRPVLMPLSPPPPQARRRSLAGRANFSAAANKGRKTSRSFRLPGRDEHRERPETFRRAKPTDPAPFPVRRGNVPPRHLGGRDDAAGQARPGPQRKQPVCTLQRRAEDKKAGKTLRRKTFLQARSEDQRRRGRELPATFPQTRKPDLSFAVGSPAPRASSKGSLSRRGCMSEAPSPQARSEGRKATRLGGIRQKWAGDGSAPQARSAHPQRIAASRKQEARALPRLSGRRAAPRVSIRFSGRRQTRATWWNLRPVPSSRRCRLRAAPQCAGKCTARGRSPCCPWWRKTDRKSSSGSLR